MELDWQFIKVVTYYLFKLLFLWSTEQLEKVWYDQYKLKRKHNFPLLIQILLKMCSKYMLIFYKMCPITLMFWACSQV